MGTTASLLNVCCTVKKRQLTTNFSKLLIKYLPVEICYIKLLNFI